MTHRKTAKKKLVCRFCGRRFLRRVYGNAKDMLAKHESECHGGG